MYGQGCGLDVTRITASPNTKLIISTEVDYSVVHVTCLLHQYSMYHYTTLMVGTTSVDIINVLFGIMNVVAVVTANFLSVFWPWK